MSRIAFITLGQIDSAATRLGIKLPKTYTTEAAALLELHNKSLSYARNVRHIDVAETIVDALATGSDPYDDTVVHEALMHAEVARHSERVNAAVQGRITAFLGNAGADIITAFKPAVEKAGATLHAAAERFGDLTLDDANEILRRGGDAADVWTAARKAEHDIQAVLSIRSYLAATGGSGIRNAGQYNALTIADIPAEDFIAAKIGTSVPNGYHIAQQGWTFSLATPDQLEARINRVLFHTGAGREEHLANEAREERRRTLGMAVDA